MQLPCMAVQVLLQQFWTATLYCLLCCDTAKSLDGSCFLLAVCRYKQFPVAAAGVYLQGLLCEKRQLCHHHEALQLQPGTQGVNCTW